MSIPQKLASTVRINVKDGKCTEYTDIQVTLKQKDFKLTFDPTVIDDTTLTIPITESQAKRFDTSSVSWQVIAKDADGVNIYTPIYTVGVDGILQGWSEDA